jgi:hypothetical protein
MEKKFLERRLADRRLKKSFWSAGCSSSQPKKIANPQRLASRRLKKSFLVAGCAPGPKKTIFQAWEVQPARFGQPAFFFSGLGSPAGAPMTIFQTWAFQPVGTGKFLGGGTARFSIGAML